jgi:hypothetical protein
MLALHKFKMFDEDNNNKKGADNGQKKPPGGGLKISSMTKPSSATVALFDEAALHHAANHPDASPSF